MTDAQSLRAARTWAALVPVVHRCVADVDALHLLAYMYSGEHATAEDSVVDAVATTADRPGTADAEPSGIWHLLARHVHAEHERTSSGDPAETGIRVAGPTRRQREALALVSTGRNPDAAAVFLGISSAQVQNDLRIASRLLHTALQSHPGGAPQVARRAIPGWSVGARPA